jgi:hypothetical protein
MVIITGLHRGGTTFLGKIVEQSNKFNYIHEPFNYWYGAKGVPCWYPYINPQTKEDAGNIIPLLNDLYNLKLKYKIHYHPTDSFFKKLARNFIKSKGHLDYIRYKFSLNKKEVLLKDPSLSLCAAYLANEFDDIKVVYIIRHPVAFYQSLKRMDWNFDFKNLYDQPNLLADYLNNPGIARPDSSDVIETVPALWNIINTIIYDQAAFLGPEKAYVIKHEDLSMNPVEEVTKLFSFLDIPVNEAVLSYIQKNMTNGVVQPKSKVVFEFSRNSKELAYSWKKNYKPEYDDIIRKTNPLLKKFNY